MYNIAPRVFEYKSTTGEIVGPNTYVVCNPKTTKQNCVPFLSSQIATPSFVEKLNTDAIYNIRNYGNKVKGGVSLQDKTPRFIYKSDLTPGPTKYNAKPICCKKKKLVCDPTKPKIYVCAVPYTTTVIAPSIPTKNDSAGYEIDENGGIIKLPPEKPIPIDINIKSNFGKGAGWKWACRSSQRFKDKEQQTCGPGPAAPSLKTAKNPREEEYENFREMARRLTYIPRYVEAQEIKAAKEKRPGPGDYNAQKPEACCKKAKSRKLQCVVRSTQQFPIKNDDTAPGPTSYNICDCYRNQKQFSRKCVAFGIEASRFPRKKIICTPGPGDYEIKGIIEENLKKKQNPYASCIPPFNSTVSREINFVPYDSKFKPSAADYPEDNDKEVETLPISSYVFVNNVCRFYSPADKKDYVGPKYNTTESFSKNRDRKSFHVSDVPFNMSGIRSTTPAVKFGVPCSTTYKNEKGLDDKGYHFAVSPRFICEEERPGPGSYNIHPQIENSFYKAFDTHNLRLKENVLRKKLRLAPRATLKSWLSTMKKKKLLKWFNTELDFEERMIMLIQELFDKPI